MTWAELAAFLLVLGAAAAVPGPDIAAIVARALAHGFRGVLPIACGIVLGHAMWMLAALVGLSTLAQMFGTLFLVLKLAGVAYLLYLAWQLWRANPEDSAQASHASGSDTAGFASGLLVAVSNPKALVFFSAVVPSILPLQSMRLADIALVEGLSALVIFAVFCVWGLAVARARAALLSASRRRTLNRVSALVMAITGLAIALR